MIAFARDPIIRFQFQDDETYPARAAAFFGHYFDVRLEGGEIFVTNGGAALWSPPGGNRLGNDFVETDWRYVERYYQTNALPRWEDCIVRGAGMITPSPIPPLTHRQVEVRFAF